VTSSVERLAARLAVGPAAAGGVWGSSYALITADIAKRLDRPFLLVTAAPDEALEDLATFLDATPTLFPESEASEIAGSDRIRTAMRLRRGELRAVVASPRSAKEKLPSPETLDAARVRFVKGDRLVPDRLALRLVESKYDRVHAVELPGQFAIRGGIVDLFPFGASEPARIELFGDDVESIRSFRVSDQGSTQELPAFEFALLPATVKDGTIDEFLPEGGFVVLRDLDVGAFPTSRIALSLQSVPVPETATTINLRTLSLQRFSGQLANVAHELDALPGTVVIACPTDGDEQRLRQLLRDAAIRRMPELRRGVINHGFTFEEAAVTWLPHHQLFNRARQRRPAGRRSDTRPIDSLLELERGDVVVHLLHGIGRFLGIERLEGGDFVALEYEEHAKLYVPVANIDLIQKYIGGGGDEAPELSRLGSDRWSAQKARAEQAVEKLAKEMLQVQAVREMELGIAFPPDTDWQRAFEAAFPFEETPDQHEAIADIKKDMETNRPMDRLLCGDVGFGKTELAMRAAFKAATANRQVAVLVPTTVLAEQHYRTFRDRMAAYPVTIEVLSRFRTQRQQTRILKELAAGKIDIVIGTHRIVQKDVAFKDLGLVVIDEEQRFGVEHKERLKQLRATVDVLTLTATPIPRTMHMALLGLRDISTLETPPRDRMAIRTEVLLSDDRRIREAILFEVNRGGQVFFVHNRVYSIDAVARRLRMLVPEARFGVGHGQMDEDELERAMIAFLERKTDVLVATTIIESGLDIPTANTMIIDNADQFGLADLHQLRGRVGRWTHQAHCYLLLPTDRKVLPQAQKRIKAIEEFSELGSGFKIAMRDVEIRGVGNLLGREQHGHIAAVGYDLYVRMLERAVKKMRRQEIEDLPDAAVELGFDALVPESYIADLRSRVEAYRRVVACRDANELDAARRELADRYGPPPEEVENFLLVVRLKQLAQKHRFPNISLGRDLVVVKFLEKPRAERVARRNADTFRIVDHDTAHVFVAARGPSLAQVLVAMLES
jgi:transcription-repair coupling factor (superfamily II helicase)